MNPLFGNNEFAVGFEEFGIGFGGEKLFDPPFSYGEPMDSSYGRV